MSKVIGESCIRIKCRESRRSGIIYLDKFGATFLTRDLIWDEKHRLNMEIGNRYSESRASRVLIMLPLRFDTFKLMLALSKATFTRREG